MKGKRAAFIGFLLSIVSFWLFPVMFDVGWGTIIASLVVCLYISFLPIRRKL